MLLERGRHLVRFELPGCGTVRLMTDLTDGVIGGHIRAVGVWEPAETALVRRVVGPGERAADIGAHVGYFAILLSRLIGPAGRVLAFEPEPGNFELLKANCILNGCGNVEPMPYALAAEPGRYELHLSSCNAGDHRLVLVPGRPTVLVEGARFDDLWAEGGCLDFAKIDVQGFELPVMLGMTRTIRASLDRLVCLTELSPQLSCAAGHDLGSLISLLRQYGCVIGRHYLDKDRPVVERLDEAELAALWARLLAAERDDAGENVVLAFGPGAWDRLAARLGGT